MVEPTVSEVRVASNSEIRSLVLLVLLMTCNIKCQRWDMTGAIIFVTSFVNIRQVKLIIEGNRQVDCLLFFFSA